MERTNIALGDRLATDSKVAVLYPSDVTGEEYLNGFKQPTEDLSGAAGRESKR
jgi:hypothetical protein